MVKFFKNKSIVALIFLVMLCFAVHAHFFVSTPLVVISDDGLLSFILQKYIKPLDGTFIFIIYFILVLLQSIRLNMVLNQQKMFQQAGFTTGMSYVLFTAFLPQWCALTPALIANSFAIWIFIQLTKLYNYPTPKTLLFNTGLMVGITILSYHPTALLIIAVLFALVVLRPFKITEWLVLLMGIVTPYYFLVSGLFLTNNINLLNRFIPAIQFNIPIQQIDSWLGISLFVIAVLLISGFYFWLPATNRVVIQIRKNWYVMLVMLLVFLTVPFIFKTAGIQSAILLSVPVVAFMSNAFLNPKRLWYPNLLFWLAIVIIIHNNLELTKI